MRYLIDTHILIWYANGNSKLSDKFKKEIDLPQNQIIISKASIWEIAIKVSLGKLELGMPFGEVENYLREKEIEQLAFSFSELQQMMKLPFHHRDPFDRLIIAQAITNNYTLITDDPMFHLYPVQLLKN